ncbi:MAG: biopolymer transporter ExbD, partial [Bdellovibrionales bacterium]|nr:biopolymer transporter ExbD [Bdellovibrionales bacterium]
MAGASQNSGDDAISDINIVPLVDIILVVLIIFMVTVPVAVKPLMDLNLPEASSS